MICIGVNYKKVPLSVRENYAFSAEEQERFHHILKEKCQSSGSVIVSTCNRSEIYVSGDDSDTFLSAVETELSLFKHIPKEDMLGQIYVYCAENALRHLFRVAGGLDSMILGEDEILRQVKDGYLLAKSQGTVCNEINIAFQGAMNSAKHIKTETLLSKTPVSMGTLAANRIEEFLQGAQGRRILIIGITGKIGSILAKNLYSKGITELVGTSRKHYGTACSRQSSDGEAAGSGNGMPESSFGNLRENFMGMEIGMVNFSDRYQWINDADVIVSATSGPHYTLLCPKVAEAMKKQKKRLFVDMAVPRDMDRDIAGLPGCELIDIDDFKRAAAYNNEIKLRETDKAELLLEEKLEETLKSIYMSEFMDQSGACFEALKAREFGSVFYQLKDQMSGEGLKELMAAMERLTKV